MKYLSWLALIALALAATNPAWADASGAILRCDPGSRIDGIDGDGRYVVASYSSSFNDCELRLPAGKHVVKACYEVTAGGSMTTVAGTIKCDQARDLAFDAVGGKVYRLRLTLAREWKAWIEDVTLTEANVPASPQVNKSRRDLPKDQRKSMVLVRASERDEPAFLTGDVQQLDQFFERPSAFLAVDAVDGQLHEKRVHGRQIPVELTALAHDQADAAKILARSLFSGCHANRLADGAGAVNRPVGPAARD